jgi:hypothetical protein
VESFQASDITTIADLKWEESTSKTKRGSTKAGWRLTAALDVAIPRYESLELVLVDGNLILEQLEGAARIQVHSGNVQLSASRSAIGGVDIRVNKGRARLSGAKPSTIEGKTIHWLGPGEDVLEIEVGRGGVAVVLE